MQIERANKMLFDETDRVKALHGKMLLSEVQKENGMLSDIKKQIAVLKKTQEQAFCEQQKAALEVSGRMVAAGRTLICSRAHYCAFPVLCTQSEALNAMLRRRHASS